MKQRVIVITAAALAAAACASDPAYYGEPRYGAPGYSSRAADYADYGRVVAIDVIGGSGHSTGAGAVVGGIVGGVLGHQVGSGRGNDVATVAGAVGGAVAGNEIEKRRNDGERYRIVVRMPDGRDSVFEQDSLSGIRVGDRVRIDGGRVVRD
jgi:outer membrane lipoprotein SlyB